MHVWLRRSPEFIMEYASFMSLTTGVQIEIGSDLPEVNSSLLLKSIEISSRVDTTE